MNLYNQLEYPYVEKTFDSYIHENNYRYDYITKTKIVFILKNGIEITLEKGAKIQVFTKSVDFIFDNRHIVLDPKSIIGINFLIPKEE